MPSAFRLGNESGSDNACRARFYSATAPPHITMVASENVANVSARSYRERRIRKKQNEFAQKIAAVRFQVRHIEHCHRHTEGMSKQVCLRYEAQGVRAQEYPPSSRAFPVRFRLDSRNLGGRRRSTRRTRPDG